MTESIIIEKVPLLTKHGPILGYLEATDLGKFYKFSGIPYAKPPLGLLRFLPPVPIQPWTEMIDCTNEPKHCITLRTESIVGSEDCLYLNVITNNLKPDRPRPVMFWIGCFYYAFSRDSILDPSLLINEDVVYVNCGFRYGPFGFLSINDPVAPGNVGLKDLVVALRWIQTNISSFGGDPTNVTLFGSSCGGAIAHFMMLSSMASGLFHKVIIQSASALNSWALSKNPTHSVMALANELGITTTCKVEIVDALRCLSAEEILIGFTNVYKKFIKTETDVFDTLFKPCIEDEFEGQSAFLTKAPMSIIKSGKFNKVPMIIGNNQLEASMLEYVKREFYTNFEQLNENTRLIVPKELSGDANMSKNIGQQILHFYIGEDQFFREDTKNQYLQMKSDYYFLYYTNKAVRMHSKFRSECPVYYYIMNYAADWPVPPKYSFFNSIGHCSDLNKMFRMKFPGTSSSNGGRDSVIIRQRVVRMWTNFAKYSNPTPDNEDRLLNITWDPVENEDRLHYLLIGSELTKGRNPFNHRMIFWDQLHNEHTFLRALVYFSDMGVHW